MPQTVHADTTLFSDDFTATDGTTWQSHNNLYSKIGSSDGTIQNNKGIIGDGNNINLSNFSNGCIATDITLPLNNGVFLGLRDAGGNSTVIYSYIAATGSFGIQAKNEGGGLGDVTLPSS